MGKIREFVYTDTEGLDLTDDEITRLTLALPPYFGDKVKASARREKKMQRLAAGLLLIYLLNCRGIKAAGVDIGEGPHGKPELKNAGGLYFNLSHSSDLVLMILAGDEAGCDIQKIKTGSAKIPARFFTPEENELLKKAGECDTDRIFTRLWARKESYIKALGEGLTRDLRSFSVLSGRMPDGFCIADYELEDYAAALCMRPDEEALPGYESFPDLRFIPFQNLVNVL